MPNPLETLLEPNDRILWQRYLKESDTIGETHHAVALATDLIRNLKAYSGDRANHWVQTLCAQVADDHVPIQISFPLLSELILPLLFKRGFPQSGASARWFAFFIDHIYRYPVLRKQVEPYFLPPRKQAKIMILERALEFQSPEPRTVAMLEEVLKPSTSSGRLTRIHELKDRFSYSLHELPSGVLYGIDGATIADCGRLLDDVDEFMLLAMAHGVADQYFDSIVRWKYFFSAYQNYLLSLPWFGTFAAYLEKYPAPQSCG